MWNRYALCLAVAALAFGSARAQSDEYQRLAEEWSRLYKQYAGSGTTFDAKDYEERKKLWPRMEELRKRMDALNAQRTGTANAEVDRLAQPRENLAAKTDYFNNVTSLRKKDALDRWVDERRKAWDAENGRRIGIINPYTGSEYYRYYDEKGGTLVVSKVRGDYDLLERQRADWEQSYKRAKWLLESVNGDVELLRREFGEATAIKARMAQAMSPPRPVDPTPRPTPQPEPRPAEGEKKLCYICWFDNSPHYGGMTREEALKDGRWSKDNNRSYRIRVTEHYTSPGQSIDAISRTPGKTILDLP